ncbi:MBOAT family O-acyltransferase [Pedobacter polysacchareus]|uniref:MBOAT family O-acyltransferase n=1 Tax=Pedobacter polysacchareus TaxID=2861973 RepID=UPI001C9990D6|nr:MBOAT family O-acyltransferase [Pedobacter polysacchareus]
MLFQSIKFIFIFFPITLVTFLLLNRRYPKLAAGVLIVASLFFCGYNDFRAFIVLIGSGLFNYFTALMIDKCKAGSRYQSLFLGVGILLNFYVLFWYKFFSASTQHTVVSNDPNANLILEFGIPLGLSFYTLYQISLLVDIYRGKAKLCDFKSYFLSVTMFAHLPAGPILRYKTSIKQFVEAGRTRITEESIGLGISLFTFGLFKKTVFADTLAIFTGQMFVSINSNAHFTFLESLATVWAFLLQLYFDFSAYSDMAIGLGLCFGFKFPVNFNSPLKAISFTDYVARWHISLIAFNREYIFIPVSKLMLKLLKGNSPFNNYLSGIVATMIVYISIGFWHSPTLQFLFSGVGIGLILTISQLMVLIFRRWWPMKLKLGQIGRVLNQVKVLFIAAIAGSLLMLNDLSSFRSLLAGFGRFDFRTDGAFWLTTGTSDFFSMIKKPIYLFGYESYMLPFPLFILICSMIAVKGPNSMELFGLMTFNPTKWNKFLVWKPNLFWGLVTGFLLALYLIIKLDNRMYQDFLYGQF